MANEVAVLINYGICTQKGNYTDTIIVEQVTIGIKHLNQHSIESLTYPASFNGIYLSLG